MTAALADVMSQVKARTPGISARDLKVCMHYLDGMSMDKVGAKVGMGRSGVHRILHKHGVPIRPKGDKANKPRLIITRYGAAELREIHPAELGLEFPPTGMSDIERHGASMYQASAQIVQVGRSHLKSHGDQP